MLLIEDDPDDVLLARAYLGDAKRVTFAVTAVSKAEDAPAALCAGEFDICLLDFMLGATTGLDVFQQVGASNIKAPVILLTGSDDEALAEEALSLGLDDYLEKDRIDPSTLERVIRYTIERKRQQDEILSLNQTLEERVLLRTHELVASNEELESLCYSISHDLRTPLRAVVSTSAFLLEDSAASLPVDVKELLARQSNAAGKMARLIDDMLLFVRLAKKVPTRIDMDMSSAARQVAEKFSVGTNLAVEVQDGMRASADPSLVNLLLSSLVDNACKFSEKQTRMIRVSMVDSVFSVEDDGIGFDNQYLGKLFQPFQKLHRDEDYSGNGIGLAVARRVAELHGGRVFAHGRPGEGAVFSFTLAP